MFTVRRTVDTGAGCPGTRGPAGTGATVDDCGASGVGSLDTRAGEDSLPGAELARLLAARLLATRLLAAGLLAVGLLAGGLLAGGLLVLGRPVGRLRVVDGAEGTTVGRLKYLPN